MILQRIKAHLVDDWRYASQWWSVRWNAIGAVVLPLMTLVPELPASVQGLFPPAVRAIVAGLWCVASIGFRLLAQKGVPGGK
jgi:hypothetical protein